MPLLCGGFSVTYVFLLGLSLLSGLLVVGGLVGSVSAAARHPEQTTAAIDWSDLTYGFTLLGVVTGFVLVLLVVLLVDAGQGELVLRFVERLR